MLETIRLYVLPNARTIKKVPSTSVVTPELDPSIIMVAPTNGVPLVISLTFPEILMYLAWLKDAFMIKQVKIPVKIVSFTCPCVIHGESIGADRIVR